MSEEASNTKSKIIELGDNFLRSRGFNSFSFKDISDELGLKKAAVHYHYPTKEDLGNEIIERAKTRLNSFISDVDSSDKNEWQKLSDFLDFYAEYLKEEHVCLIGSVGAEFYTLPDSMQSNSKQFISSALVWLTQLLELGKNKGIFQFNGEPEARALMILSNMSGGLLLARMFGDEQFAKIINGVKQSLMN
ncbi:TetR/AcrR family transcriptional regulator [Marinigracilibium pacificum]|uniref:TetR/AcrR family transcriptional regulator n=1 Tax=Marinigracilibium pacificum TaxID=2729599 RepID=A0A848J5J2_9BACT|nr:TetR/AcrR family transcriptional regulator [Marinigracilibium pacificum]NMM49734.1 TetR/AcrR family transcriptional regulator [Marinigracilibium pacificum]